MRTPPPVLPPDDESSGYRSTWMDRNGPDAGVKIRTARYAIIVFPLALTLWGVVVTQKLGVHGTRAPAPILLGAVATTIVVFYAGLASAGAGGANARAYTMPSGSSTPYEEQFSYQESLAARGGALP